LINNIKIQLHYMRIFEIDCFDIMFIM